MPRVIGAILAVGFAAPTLVIAISAICQLLVDADQFLEHLNSTDYFPLHIAWLIFFLSTAVFVLPPLFVLALVGRRIGWTSRWLHIAFGCLIGLGAVGYVTDIFSGVPQDEPLSDLALVLLIYVPTGAVCGWIYWRIALSKRTGQASTEAAQRTP